MFRLLLGLAASSALFAAPPAPPFALPPPVTVAAPTETVVDIDGNTYSTIRTGDPVCAVENLRTTRFNDAPTHPRGILRRCLDNHLHPRPLPLTRGPRPFPYLRPAL
jgi:hypothetical protein